MGTGAESPLEGGSRLGSEGGSGSLGDAVEPADGRPRSGVSKGFELVVPGLAEREVDQAPEFVGVASGQFDRGADPVLRDDHIAHDVGLGVEDPQPGGRRPAAPLGDRSAVLGDLEAQMLPAAERRGEHGPRADLADP